MSIRKALGAVKDKATIGIARVTGAVAPDLDVAIVRATSHDDAPPDERHAREVLRLASATGTAPACVASIARRLSKTRDYVVAAKCLALLHRLVAASDSDSDPAAEDGDARDRVEGGVGTRSFLHELLRPALTGRRAGEPVLALLLDFRDDAHTASWDHSAFVRAYATYLLDRVRYLVLLLPAPRFADDRVREPPPQTAAANDMDTEALLGRARHLRHLLDRVLACRPAGAAGASRVLRAALLPLLRDSFKVYEDVALLLAILLDRFFDMDYPECVKAFETYVGTAKQIDALRAFYAWCDDAGVARSSNFPDVRRVDDKLLETMEQFLRQRGRAGRASPPRSARESSGDARGDDDMNAIKALPAPPPTRSSVAETARPVVVPAKEADQSDLVDLREPAATADEQGNKLALALFSAPPATNGTWVTFPSESDDAAEPAVTSAWQTPAAEPGKADWELALVETASNLSKQTASMGGGMDTLLLGGMYDQGAVRQQVAAQAASGSASSVALLLPGGRQVPPVLMLPGPDGSTVRQVAGGDPFAASLAVRPPSYVQMAEMERKQHLLLQEQQMWAQYRHGGMQGQPAGFNGLAGGSVFAPNAAMAVPYGGYGMPPMAYNQVGGYY